MKDIRRLELVVAGCVVETGRYLGLAQKHKEWLPPGGHLEQNESPNDTSSGRFWKKQGSRRFHGSPHGP